VILDLVAVEPTSITTVRAPEEGVDVHVADALAGLEVPALREARRLADLGAGGGFPGLALAVARPDATVTLVESVGRKCDFLRRAAADFANVRVVHGRAEEQPLDAWEVAVAKALAEPRVAAEWCLALVRPGGAAVLYVAAAPEAMRVSEISRRLGGGEAAVVPVSAGRALLVLPKLEPTPAGFPRRPGAARKRPLA
jgi:16S rRNA (guanine527-N7)-methyltransferase